MSEPWHFCQDCGEESGATKERDELRAQVARLEKTCATVESDLRAMIRYHGRVAGDRDRLGAALETYGRHDAGCARAGLEFKLRGEDYPCSCGLEEALKGAE